MRVLTLCAYGNVRSVALARILKDDYHQEALAAGLVACTPETLRMLFGWAEAILLTDSSLDPVLHADTSEIPYEKFHDFDVGLDRWGQPGAPELVHVMREKTAKSGMFTPPAR